MLSGLSFHLLYLVPDGIPQKISPMCSIQAFFIWLHDLYKGNAENAENISIVIKEENKQEVFSNDNGVIMTRHF